MIVTVDEARSLADTNVVVYAYDVSEPTKHRIAQDLLVTLSNSRLLAFSTQVLNEFSAVMLRRGIEPITGPKEVYETVKELTSIGEVLRVEESTTLSALDAMLRYSLSFWDSLIWATAKENGVSVIYSEDFQHGQTIEGVQFRNPFL